MKLLNISTTKSIQPIDLLIRWGLLASLSLVHSLVLADFQASALTSHDVAVLHYQQQSNALLERQIADHEDPSLKFNRLWIKQHQRNYKPHSLGAVAGKLLRRQIKRTYHTAFNTPKTVVINHHQNIQYQEQSPMDFGLRVSPKRVKLNLSYQF